MIANRAALLLVVLGAAAGCARARTIKATPHPHSASVAISKGLSFPMDQRGEVARTFFSPFEGSSATPAPSSWKAVAPYAAQDHRVLLTACSSVPGRPASVAVSVVDEASTVVVHQDVPCDLPERRIELGGLGGRLVRVDLGNPDQNQVDGAYGVVVPVATPTEEPTP